MENTPVSGKKGKKKSKNTKTVSLNDFLGDVATPGTIKPMNWADEADEEILSVNNSLAYQSSSSHKVITLPTEPRAARTVEVDQSKIPRSGPYTAYVGNLPYEADPETIGNFFKGLPIVNVRFPEENGRFKGFGYIEFADRMSLIKALEMNEEILQRRTIRVDIADNQGRDGGRDWRGGDRDRHAGGPDPTEGDWRKASRDTFLEKRDDRRGGDFGSNFGGGYQDRRGDRYGSRQDSYDRGYQKPSYSRGSSRDYGNDDDGGSWRRSSNSSDQFSRRSSDSRYDGGRYGGDSGYDRQSNEPPRERPQLKLQPRQKPLTDQSAPATRSAIFGNAKPVDTAAKEKEIEEKISKMEMMPKEPPAPEKRSQNIFGSAKPVDTTARQREIEEKLAAQEKEMIEQAQSQQKPPVQSKSVSIFGAAKPVDTAAREKEIEEKIRKQEEQLLKEFGEDPSTSSQSRPRRMSDRSDDYNYKSPRRRSRTSSTKSTDENEPLSPQRNARKSSGSGSGDPRKGEFKPAPAPKESAWGRPKGTVHILAAPPATNAWNIGGTPRGSQQRGEREEAEGNSREDEEEERTPEGAADDESTLRPRSELADGSEATERPPRPRYSAAGQQQSDNKRTYGRRDDKSGGGFQPRGGASGRGGARDDFHGNRRRGDGDSEAHRSDRHQGYRSRRDHRNTKGESSEKKRDSSGDSRPECDRPDAAGQEQPASRRGKQKGRSNAAPPVLEEKPVSFVTSSKFALLAVDDSDDDTSN